MKHRWEIINWLIEKRGYKRYLEIGVKDGVCFNRVKCESKTGVDIKPLIVGKNIHTMSSDQFFEGPHWDELFDIIFIDGDHREKQVLTDLSNALSALDERGAIVMHDCNPKMEAYATSERGENQPLWSGTAYRAYLRYREYDERLAMCVVDIDWGCGVITFGGQTPLKLPFLYQWEEFDENRVEWLNLISVEDFRRKFR